MNLSCCKAGVVFLFTLGIGSLPQSAVADQTTPFLGEVMCGSWTFCPKNWAECNGQFLSISQNTALFSLLGVNFGGNGTTTFALPDLRGRTPLGQGQGSGLTNRTIGQASGVESVTLTQQQMPAHGHPVQVHTGSEKSASPTNRVPGVAPATAPAYVSPPTPPGSDSLNVGSIGVSGGSQPHENRQPYLVVRCCIALYGIYPSRN